jgi:chromosome condensin MukBEF MukE localization factor
MITLLNPSINQNTAKVFQNITQEVWNKSVAKLQSIEDSKLLTYINVFGSGTENDKKKLFEILVERKNKLLAYKFSNRKIQK